MTVNALPPSFSRRQVTELLERFHAQGGDQRYQSNQLETSTSGGAFPMKTSMESPEAVDMVFDDLVTHLRNDPTGDWRWSLERFVDERFSVSLDPEQGIPGAHADEARQKQGIRDLLIGAFGLGKPIEHAGTDTSNNLN